MLLVTPTVTSNSRTICESWIGKISDLAKILTGQLKNKI
jgi:hypothetical protein